MYRVPVRHPSPGAPRPAGRFPSPPWVFHGARSPSVGPRCGGSLQYGGSPRASSGCSPASPAAFSNRGYGDSPAGFSSRSRGYSDSPAAYGAGSRGYGDSPAGFGSGSRGYGDSPAGFSSRSRNGDSPAAYGAGSRGYGDSPAGFNSRSRGYGDSPAAYSAGSRGYGDSPAGFGAGSRGYGGSGGKMRRRPDGFRRSHGAPGPQGFQDRSDAVEKYFSPAMLQDPWADLQPVAR